MPALWALYSIYRVRAPGAIVFKHCLDIYYANVVSRLVRVYELLQEFDVFREYVSNY